MTSATIKIINGYDEDEDDCRIGIYADGFPDVIRPEIVKLLLSGTPQREGGWEGTWTNRDFVRQLCTLLDRKISGADRPQGRCSDNPYAVLLTEKEAEDGWYSADYRYLVDLHDKKVICTSDFR